MREPTPFQWMGLPFGSVKRSVVPLVATSNGTRVESCYLDKDEPREPKVDFRATNAS